MVWTWAAHIPTSPVSWTVGTPLEIGVRFPFQWRPR